MPDIPAYRPTRNPDTGGSSSGGNPVVGQPYRRGTSAYTDWLNSHPNQPASNVPYRPSQTTTFGVFTPYRSSDLNSILLRVVNQGTIVDLQQALVHAGLLTDNVTYGYIDGDTSDAFEALLSLANQNGLAWQDVLSMLNNGGGAGGLGSGGSGSGGSSGGLAPTIITLPNRDDVIAAAEDTGMSLTGHAMDDDLAASVADHILNTLRTQQERQFQTEQGITGSGVHFSESAPDAGRLLEEEVRRRDPLGVAGKGVRDTVDTLLGTLAGPVSTGR